MSNKPQTRTRVHQVVKLLESSTIALELFPVNKLKWSVYMYVHISWKLLTIQESLTNHYTIVWLQWTFFLRLYKLNCITLLISLISQWNRIYCKHLKENLYLGCTLRFLEDTQLVILKIQVKYGLKVSACHLHWNTRFHMFNSCFCSRVTWKLFNV